MITVLMLWAFAVIGAHTGDPLWFVAALSLATLQLVLVVLAERARSDD